MNHSFSSFVNRFSYLEEQAGCMDTLIKHFVEMVEQVGVAMVAFLQLFHHLDASMIIVKKP